MIFHLFQCWISLESLGKWYWAQSNFLHLTFCITLKQSIKMYPPDKPSYIVKKQMKKILLGIYILSETSFYSLNDCLAICLFSFVLHISLEKHVLLLLFSLLHASPKSLFILNCSYANWHNIKRTNFWILQMFKCFSRLLYTIYHKRTHWFSVLNMTENKSYGKEWRF